MTQTTNRNTLFDLMRSFAVCYILFHHVNDYSGHLFASNADTVLTYLSLSILFFISGAIISEKYPELLNFNQVLSFLGKRAKRIVPLYLLALLAFRFFMIVDMSFLDLIINGAVLINSILIPVFSPAIKTLWFVSVLFFLYGLYALSAMIKLRFSYMVYMVSISGAIFTLHLLFDIFDRRLLLYIFPFLLGVILSRYDLHAIFSELRFLCLSTVIFVISILLYIYFDQQKAYIFRFPVQIIMNLTSIAPTIFLFTKLDSVIGPSSFIRNVSYASFCMYLFHRVVYTLFDKYISIENNMLSAIALIVICVPITTLLSYYLQNIYDEILSTRFIVRSKIER